MGFQGKCLSLPAFHAAKCFSHRACLIKGFWSWRQWFGLDYVRVMDTVQSVAGFLLSRAVSSFKSGLGIEIENSVGFKWHKCAHTELFSNCTHLKLMHAIRSAVSIILHLQFTVGSPAVLKSKLTLFRPCCVDPLCHLFSRSTSGCLL